ncbi:hypothetical protein GIB67_018393 [Kingdonia uniflora]|uniref:ABC transporter domain-containing protein n=1 Tax=Kingdonia uniflora TaxID=39325 RepID=A0A7J7MJ96_9MAGN|nr:hypothetical protein GIB67_018393 [Kingdonia uniflora]
MAQMVGVDEIESLRMELAEIGRSLRLSFQLRTSSFRSTSSVRNEGNEESDLQWAAIERLPTFEKLRTSLFDNQGDVKGKRVIDVTKLQPVERRMFIEKLIKQIEKDNLRLLQKLRERIDRVGVNLPTVEVRYKNLCVEAECEVVYGKPLPTLWNSFKGNLSGIAKLFGAKSKEAQISIIKEISGIIKPGRMTLLLGPPGCGKTTLLLALSGKLDQSLKVAGEISYNGYKLEEFIPQKTAVYISQHDLHIPEMTVRETLDFSACCQGIGSRAEIMRDITRREKQAGVVPDPDLDTYMKAISVEGLQRTLQTDYTLKILGLDHCADTMVGDAMRRGVSGGQKKRVTTGEMIVGPTKAMFMDEISNGLDSSTTLQVVACLQQMVHITDATVIVSLLQPAPETYNLFDDIILMGEGKVVYHGPRSLVLKFFEECGFKCPERKGTADFLQEVISRKDQGQYWYIAEKPYSYVSVDQFSRSFIASNIGQKLYEELQDPYDKSQSHNNALTFNMNSLTKWELFKACMAREFLLMRRNSFIYIFKSTQLVIIAAITMTVFLRTRMDVDVVHANYYLGSLFYGLIILFVDGFPEISMTVARLAVFYKQRDLYFYPAWAYTIPATILKVPLSLLESFVWTVLTYYVIGYSPEFGRFVRQFLLFFALHLMSLSMFRFIGSLCRTVVSSVTAGCFTLLVLLLFGGFIIPQPSLPSWLQWGFWVSPLTYGEIGLTLNEFLAPRWQTVLSTNTTIGIQTLESRGLNFKGYFYWVSLGALFGFSILFNIGFTLALSILKSPGIARAIISHEKLAKLHRNEDFSSDAPVESKSTGAPKTMAQSKKGGLVLPFEPLTVAFQDVRYFIDAPLEMREQGFKQRKLQLLHDITGAFTPGVLTALMGVSGAGKTTLLDVLSGRKTGGTIEGEIKISGYAKVQETFARISGYCEQSDIHSPQITVEESVIYSAWLRLPSEIDSITKSAFVNEVLETIELDEIKDALVGIPGVNGLSTEQRKRLTIAVELVANPSIIFMDEPTSGLDARAAAIVMRAVKNVVNTGRTVVCTIHQPSIDIFEAFDEIPAREFMADKFLIKIMGISGVQMIKENYNPATWMLEVTNTSAEAELGVDFANLYKESTLFKDNKELVNKLCSPPPGSKDLHFGTRFPQNGWGQFKSCLWKQQLTYWRSPTYNLTRMLFMIVSSLLFGTVFWKQGSKISSSQDLFNVFGSMFVAVIFLGINNCSSVLPFVGIERDVLYREKFAGMYSSWTYSFAQRIPGWWIWLYYLTPTSWTLNGLLTSQYGDLNQEIMAFGEMKSVANFLRDYFGFHHDRLGIVAIVLIAFPVVFASLFAYCIGKLNFQRR